MSNQYWVIRFTNQAEFYMWFVEYDTQRGDCSLTPEVIYARRFLTENSAYRLIEKLKTIYPDKWGPTSEYKITVESRELQ